MAKKLAKSLSGHDKGHCYVIIKEDPDVVWLADGITKTMEKPKRKNVKHIQVIKDLPEELEHLLNIEETPTDLVIKRVLKLYTK